MITQFRKLNHEPVDPHGIQAGRSSHYMTPAVERVLSANERRRDRRLRAIALAVIFLGVAAAIAAWMNW